MESERDLTSWAYILFLFNLLRIVVKDCGAPLDPGPQWTLPGLRRMSRAVGLWPMGPADPQQQLSHVYDGIFLLLHQSASSTVWPPDSRQAPSFSSPPLPFSSAYFTALFWSHTNIHCSLPVHSCSHSFYFIFLSGVYRGLRFVP